MLKLVQNYGKDLFHGIVFDNNPEIGWGSCDWNGKIDEPHPLTKKDEKCIWSILHPDQDTLDSFVGETKIQSNVNGEKIIYGKLWWD